MSVLVLVVLALVAGIPGFGSTESVTQEVPAEPFTGRIFTLEDGDIVTYPPGEAKPGDKVVCVVDGKTGIHAETAPPGSW